MRQTILILSLLFFISPCFAGDKVYTDEDLDTSNVSSYKSKTDSEVERKADRIEYLLSRRKELAKEDAETLISDKPLYQKCRIWRANDDEFDSIFEEMEPDRETKIAHYNLKYSHRKLCGKLY